MPKSPEQMPYKPSEEEIQKVLEETMSETQKNLSEIKEEEMLKLKIEAILKECKAFEKWLQAKIDEIDEKDY